MRNEYLAKLRMAPLSENSIVLFQTFLRAAGQIIHKTARRSADRQYLAKHLFRELDRILKNCIPKRSIFFAFDGPGPLAKLMTQRRRRSKDRQNVIHVKSHRRRKTSRTAADSTTVPKKAIDPLEFTPGVDLLYFLRDAVSYWAYTRLQNDRKYAYVDVLISGPDVAAEGELKIVDFCRSGKVREHESLVVVGGDADIVLQGMATTTIRNFLVFLQYSGGSKRSKDKANSIVSVWELCRSLERRFPNQSSAVRLDFVLLSILHGNGTSSCPHIIRSTQIFTLY